MNENYGPSSAPLVDAGAQSARSSLVAVLLGGLVVDAFGSVVLVSMLASALIALAGGLGSTGIAAVSTSIAFMIVAVGGGSLLVVAGGYTAAWWARRRPMAHALGAGCLSLLVALAGFWLQRTDTSTLWLDVATLALHLPLAALGGWMCGRSQPVE